jgi:hypothetical protein
MKSQLPNTAQGYIIMLAGFRNKRFAKNGYFYEVLQVDDCMHALDNVLL